MGDCSLASGSRGLWLTHPTAGVLAFIAVLVLTLVLEHKKPVFIVLSNGYRGVLLHDRIAHLEIAA